MVGEVKMVTCQFSFTCSFTVDGHMLHVLLLGSETPSERDPVQEVCVKDNLQDQWPVVWQRHVSIR